MAVLERQIAAERAAYLAGGEAEEGAAGDAPAPGAAAEPETAPGGGGS